MKLMFFNDYRLGVLKDGGRVVDVTKVVPGGEALPRSDPARRRSKRLQDLVDAQALLEDAPALRDELNDVERTVLDSLPE